ncbi:glucose dehydrogenase [FAD, quinone]-like [Sitophilus oryzae]|uniref:Glucose dehydrogenase [FAD, quinone]-like n=1 Tax=Sitophilus oryzae TaxID=7048 RepID=A0A6J2XQH7_SITOR|nr:glucose dehydrogenase [FAD, quinone]-like [Sitophilus oryzae]
MPTGIITYDITHLRGAFANAFLILINALFFNIKLIGDYTQYPADASSKLLDGEETTFDFIIVGAGAAGCALANRLSQQDQWSVLLIEAGDIPETTTAVPALFPTFFESALDTWQYRLEKDKETCRAYKNKQCSMFRGRVLGGTSSINNLHYYRERSLENSLNLIYQSIEYYPNAEGENVYEGDIQLEKINSSSEIRSVLREAYEKLSFNEALENSPLGILENYLTIKEGERLNMARAFLTSVKSRSNFFLAKNTVVDSIVTNHPIDKRVKGVNVTISDKKVFLQARKELILTAGSINNAKLMLLSGMGAKDYLLTRKIPVILDLPGVGKNLQMHVTIPMFVSLNATFDSNQSSELEFIRSVFDYIMVRSGNLSTIGIHDFSLYASTAEHPTDPTIAIHHNYFHIQDRMLAAWLNGWKFEQKISTNLLEKNRNQPILLFLVTLMQPKSRGEILLNETHFQSSPNIVGNFLKDEENEDMRSLLTGFTLVTNATETAPLKDIGAELIDIGLPDCRSYKFCSLHYVKCYIKNMVHPTSDVAGTTARGPECDKYSVVKNDFEVKQMRCLRIADSSILNEIPVGNTVASDAMLGISVSEILKEKWIKDYVSPFKAN